MQTIDYDIHGIVGVRLIDPGDGDAKAVANQLGPLQGPLRRVPDIVIRFTETLPTPALKYLGLNSAGFTDEGFYILRSSKAKAKVRIPFEQIGNSCEIVCEHGLRSVPLLLAIVNLTFLKKKCIPLHASAFSYNGEGCMLTGWAKGGKTEALLAFANHGAQYVGDEWIILSNDGKQMFGIPEPIRLWDWQFEYVPHLSSTISMEKKILFKSIHFLDAFYRIVGRGRMKKIFPLRILNEALPPLKRQLNVRIPPERIFKKPLRKSEKFDKLFFLMSHEASDITVEPCDLKEAARRMVTSVEYELGPFFEYYHAFKFAFSHARNQFLENIRKNLSLLLVDALQKKELYRVLHPYPVDFENLYREMRPFASNKMKTT